MADKPVRFWIVRWTQDGPEEIYEGTETPNAPSHSAGYDSLEALQARCGMVERCRECNSLINHNWDGAETFAADCRAPVLYV